ncbi:NapC/NirT family cytochrome c [Desulfurivibrio sp. D14AmB]|uniref:NapC/NirT family cytochrome c n=1 Tax=Desulfurivibrio sp. D14AmB TaxID=3374370 RepID=UPI00376ECCBC
MGNDKENQTGTPTPAHESTWKQLLGAMWRSPLGLLGFTLATISATMMVIVVIIDLLGLVLSPYTTVFAFLVLPGIMIIGLLLMPLAAYLRRQQMHRDGTSGEYLHINLSDHRHRKILVAFIIITVVNFGILGVAGYGGFHFTESPYFCGMVCHQVMEPEYVAYQRSPHARVRCVDCHIGPGADWFVKSKISGLRQVVAMGTGNFSRPVPVPVEHLRPATDTCENCHWPEKFHGKRIKEFVSFTNNNQKEPRRTEVALHIGGRNPETDAFEGIHWHVSHAVEVRYLPVDKERLQIARIQVTRPDGSYEEFVNEAIEVPAGAENNWRLMDCIDCHNRPTHVFHDPVERVDFGLLSKAINGDIPGIRQDSLSAIKYDYASRQEAQEQLIPRLLELQRQRNPELARQYESDIRKAGEYLLDSYLGNVWPDMKIEWGTYQSHLGHSFEENAYGCFRCHDSKHVSEKGRTISQDCSLCHDFPY